jgi:hypothetical protein
VGIQCLPSYLVQVGIALLQLDSPLQGTVEDSEHLGEGVHSLMGEVAFHLVQVLGKREGKRLCCRSLKVQLRHKEDIQEMG